MNVLLPHLPRQVDLDSLLRKADTLHAEVGTQRTGVVAFTAEPHCVGKETLEEVYLFLKEKVHNNEDLEANKAAIHAHIFGKINRRAGADPADPGGAVDNRALVPALLELMLLEEEELLVRKAIEQLLMDPPDEVVVQYILDCSCIALQLHRIALYCVALHCVALRCIALHCVVLHCIT